ncbi:MAG: Flp pilus assembly complex ATPase component TadA [Candidatus Omnitrophica bacterium]|nr:Flp pilus assembly complex ATPase component TadA [Candidatus Omnitrophota bacterium]
MALRLGEILVEKNLITIDELNIAIAEQQKTKEAVGQILVRMGFVVERDMLQVLATQQGIPFVDLKTKEITDKVLKNVPAKFVWHYKIMPISLDGNVLTAAISNPFDMWPIDDLETHLGFKVEKVLAASSDIAEAIKKYYGVGAETIDRILSDDLRPADAISGAAEEKVEDLEKLAESASVIKLVNQILQEAITSRTTDIHIEHFRGELILRYRIDGILYDTPVSEKIKYLHPAIVSRIKVMSGLDIVERRIPQDGRAKVKIGKSEYELRVSIMPTLYGENIVIRVLPTTMLFNISDLGVSDNDRLVLDQLLKKSHGIIFVTGPTGSGKTTTLYACLSQLNSRERKILTIEDPIEYELNGISQTQINSKIGLTFAKMLRSMLRHDPDVMMVGEVRDLETAEITIQTALTGHLVFSTLHTNDAASGVTRLVDIGIEPYLVTSSVIAFIAQRLVRVICSGCKEKVSLSDLGFKDDILKIQGFDAGKDTVVYHGKGCKACSNTGYVGRAAIYEILMIGSDIKNLILAKAPSHVITEKAVQLGMHTLKQDGWDKVRAGITTPEEVLRVTQLEG